MFDKFVHSLTELLDSDGESCNRDSHSFLLAVSGGVDSAVLTHLFKRTGYQGAVAHCNFMLRGAESDADENLVRQIAANNEFRFHSKKFDTAAYAGENRISIQMAARRLRYDWFSQLARDHNYRYVLLAHHADDVVETMLINLVRGTGPAGMHGIRSSHGIFLRPLLFASRKEIETYAGKHAVEWRNDSSNDSNDYIRNKIRNQVVPVLKEINPSLNSAMLKHARITSESEKLLGYFIESIKATIVTASQSDESFIINTTELDRFPSPITVLYHLMSPLGFNYDSCRDAYYSVRTGSGVYSSTHRMVRMREGLEVMPVDTNNHTVWMVGKGNSTIATPDFNLQVLQLNECDVEELKRNPDFTNPEAAYLDESRLVFPLILRPWQHGDFFVPLGLKGSKLVSDLLVDKKLTPSQKEKIMVLESEGEIVWVAGQRISEKHKVTVNSVNCYKFVLRKNKR